MEPIDGQRYLIDDLRVLSHDRKTRLHDPSKVILAVNDFPNSRMYAVHCRAPLAFADSGYIKNCRFGGQSARRFKVDCLSMTSRMNYSMKRDLHE